MIPDIDIYRTAQVMIRRYGDTATIEAAAHADEFLDKGDLDGQRTWLRILRAIDTLTDTTPKGPTH